jgi:hypothetical protein
VKQKNYFLSFFCFLLSLLSTSESLFVCSWFFFRFFLSFLSLEDDEEEVFSSLFLLPLLEVLCFIVLNTSTSALEPSTSTADCFVIALPKIAFLSAAVFDPMFFDSVIFLYLMDRNHTQKSIVSKVAEQTTKHSINHANMHRKKASVGSQQDITIKRQLSN